MIVITVTKSFNSDSLCFGGMTHTHEANYRQLVVWQKSMDLVVEVYGCTKAFPRDELFGLASQMRRASISVPCNIS